MRSLLWTGIFCLLVVELGLTLVLVIPFPRTLRTKICRGVSGLDLKKRLRMPLVGLFVALVLALLDTAHFLVGIYTKKDEEQHQQNHFETNPIDRHLTKEKEYKAGRNLYLAGFSLTLFFVIGRITELMQEHADLEGKIENLRIAVSISENDRRKGKEAAAAAASAAGDHDVPTTEGIEMKPMGLKKKD